MKCLASDVKNIILRLSYRTGGVDYETSDTIRKPERFTTVSGTSHRMCFVLSSEALEGSRSPAALTLIGDTLYSSVRPHSATQVKIEVEI